MKARSNSLRGAMLLIAAISGIYHSVLAEPTPTIRYAQYSSLPGKSQFASAHASPNWGWQILDNFSLQDTTKITGIRWQGVYADYSTEPANRAPGRTNTDTWEVTIWSNKEGKHHQVIHTETHRGEDVDTALAGITARSKFEIYEFHLNFSEPFLAEANTAYWLSILSIADTFDPGFEWTAGTPVNQLRSDHIAGGFSRSYGTKRHDGKSAE